MLAGGGLAVATVSPALADLEITAVGRDKPTKIPAYGLVGYDLSSFGNDWAIAWSERQEGLSSVWLQIGEQRKTLITQGDYFIDDVTTTQDEHGRLFIAWARGGDGASGIFFTKVSVDGFEVAPPQQLTFGGPQDRLPSLVVYDSVIHLTYKREFVLHAEVRYKRIVLDDAHTSREAIIGETGRDVDELPLLALQADGSAVYFWLRPSLVRGQAGQSRLLKGQITANGEITSSFVPMLELNGHSNSLALTHSQADEHTLVWLNNESGTFQAYYLVMDSFGQISEQGPVTQSRSHKFDLEVHQSGRKLVLFYEMHAEELAVMYAEDRQKVEPPLAARLGLDPENPLLDAFYILVSVIVGALALTALSSLFLIPLVGLLSLLPPLRFGHYMVLWVTFSSVLGVVAKPYVGTVLLPGYMGFGLMAVSALISWSILYFARLDQSDLLTLGAFGHIYTFCLFFASLLF